MSQPFFNTVVSGFNINATSITLLGTTEPGIIHADLDGKLYVGYIQGSDIGYQTITSDKLSLDFQSTINALQTANTTNTSSIATAQTNITSLRGLITADELILDSHTTSIGIINNNVTALQSDNTTINTTLTTLPTKTGANTFTGINTFSNIGNTYYGDGANLTGIVSSGASLTANNTFTEKNTFSGGLQMTSCMFGRNDGFAFNTVPNGFTTYPIGYTLSFVDASPVAVTTGDPYSPTFPNLDAGVWLFSGSMLLIKNTGTYETNAQTYWGFTATNTGCTYYPPMFNIGPPVFGQFNMPSSTAGHMTNVFCPVTVVVTGTGRTGNITPWVVVDGVSGAITRQCSFIATKIA